MSLNVSELARQYYDVYSLTNSDAYKENAVDASAVSKETYNVSDVDTAFEVMLSADSVNFSSVLNVDSYVENAFKLSQSSVSSTSDSTVTSTEKLLSEDTSLSGIYSSLASGSSLSADEMETLVKSDPETTASDYNQYLSGIGNIVDEDI